MATKSEAWGMISEFKNVQELYKAAKVLRDAGYKKFEVYTPFPVHGMDDAMGIKPTPLPWITLACGLMGCIIGFAIQIWSSDGGYAMIVSGKPDGFRNIINFIPVGFEVTILLSAFGTIGGMLALNGLPRLHHPVMEHERFKKVTDDAFFITVECKDTYYNEVTTKELLEKNGGFDVTILED